MRRMNLVLMLLASATVLAVALLASGQGRTAGKIPLGTIFTYQGQLLENDILVEGMIELEFSLWDSPSDGNPVRDPITTLVDVQDGLFTVQLDFGKAAFNDEARWLEIAVEGTTLDQRQLITATPFGLYALNAGRLGGLDSLSFLRNLPDAVQSEHIARSAVDGSKIADNAVQRSHISANAVGSSAIQDGSITRSDLGASSVGSSAIQDNTITQDDLGTNSVGSSEIASGAVDTSELATNAVTSSKIQDGTITGADITTQLILNGGLNTGNAITIAFPGSTPYNHFGSGGSPVSGDIGNAGDLFVQNDLETGDDIYANGGVVRLGNTTSDAGFVGANGSNTQSNCKFTNLSGFPNNGFVSVQDSGGTSRVKIFVNSSGQGQIIKDISNFSVPNPNRPGTNILYACVEGPEAAAYIRGTAHLILGKAVVKFPEHFRAVASLEGMTVSLTPLSAVSKGLALVKKSLDDGLVIRELDSGEGTYDFDYLVMAVRRGYEDYEVIRPAVLEAAPAPEGAEVDDVELAP